MIAVLSVMKMEIVVLAALHAWRASGKVVDIAVVILEGMRLAVLDGEQSKGRL